MTNEQQHTVETPLMREQRRMDSASLTLPAHFGFIGTTPRVFSADDSSAIVVANRAIGEQVANALNNHDRMLAALRYAEAVFDPHHEGHEEAAEAYAEDCAAREVNPSTEDFHEGALERVRAAIAAATKEADRA